MSDFILSRATRIEAPDALPPIRNAVSILQRDMRERLRGGGPDNVIRVCLSDTLPAECYRCVAEESAVTLQCGDTLGAVYAPLFISQRFLGVQPLDWWHDLHRAPLDTAAIPAGEYDAPAYAVRFRGWFVNDEVLLEGWHDSISDRFAVWKRIFETVLRLGGNMIIPGTDRLHDGEALCRMASETGLWLTQHHSELLGAKMFARVYPDLTPSYTEHPEAFEALWRESVRENAGRRVVWCVGYRGQGDMAFWHSDKSVGSDEAARGAYVSRIMRRQMAIVREQQPDAIFCTNLYGEMMQLYRGGHLDIPEEVIKVWGDNGFGRMVSRRQNNDNPRTPSMPAPDEPGLNGVYWHVGFYDLQAANHITLLQEPPQKVADELAELLHHHGGAYWNVNVGSVRPHLFMIDLVSRLWRDGACNATQASREYAAMYFGSEAPARLLLSYADQAVSFGPNEDDLAGDQFYHFPLRYALRAFLRGQTDAPLQSLMWLGDARTYREQLEDLLRMTAPRCEGWESWLRECHSIEDQLDADGRQALRETLALSGVIHHAGCAGLAAFCRAALLALDGDDLHAFLWADEAIRREREALREMTHAAVGRFVGFYKNDCFTNVKLTIAALETFRSILRIRGDGDNWYDWEHRYLTPDPSCRVLLQTHVTNQLTDEELAARLKGEADCWPCDWPGAGTGRDA